MTESDLQTTIINALTLRIYGVMRVNTVIARARGGIVNSYIFYAGPVMDGCSDLIVFKEGRAWFLEVKRPGEKPRPNQLRFKAWCDWYKMEYHVVTSVDEALTAVGAK